MLAHVFPSQNLAFYFNFCRFRALVYTTLNKLWAGLYTYIHTYLLTYLLAYIAVSDETACTRVSVDRAGVKAEGHALWQLVMMYSVIPALAQENIYKSTTSAKVYVSISLNNDCYVRVGLFLARSRHSNWTEVNWTGSHSSEQVHQFISVRVTRTSF